ncbi:hypothetical protein RHGRI_008520 [Rhododendron griersonianum]|uniref:SLH domain-containing protein n=1 Tax=Rhododendron griersonianum TaxID=479676 RepID=A0AAV6L0H9_9ERIC|nr:hypothetical protein RHGRI_008520 [Rhododendron griersonianum]
MASLGTSTTWSPNSFQLRLALNSRKSPAVFLRMRVGKLGRQARVVSSVSANGGGNSWTSSNSSADAFSGWTGADERTDSDRKRWFGDDILIMNLVLMMKFEFVDGVEYDDLDRLGHLKWILRAGVAGVIFVAGLTFVTLSISKRNPSRTAQEMEPLATQQEVVLASDDQYDRIEQVEREGKDMKRDNDSLSKTGIENDPSFSTENNEATNENRQSGSGVGYTLNSDDALNNASAQEDLHNESAIDDMSVAPNRSPGTPPLSETKIGYGSLVASNFENFDGSLVTDKSEPVTELKENLINAKLTNSSVSGAYSTDLSTDSQKDVLGLSGTNNSTFSFDSSSSSTISIPIGSLPSNISVNSPLDAVIEPQVVLKLNGETVDLLSTGKDLDLTKAHVSEEGNKPSSQEHNLKADGSNGTASLSPVANTFANEQDGNSSNSQNESTTFFESTSPLNSFSSAGIPAPSVVSAALQVLPGKVLVPAVVDQVQGQALAALQVLKVIEPEVQPGDLCTRREYARWLVSASSTLSRNTVSKVYPAMYIENVTELAFDDITPEDPDFPSIQGLAEAGLISSKLSRRDMSSSDEDQSSLCFSPESILSRQDLVSWKMALEKRKLPDADRKILHQLSGFIDIDKINPDACPALVADLSAGENGIIALAFGYTRLFQPDKPVTNAQAAIALVTGEGSDIVSEELARIEAEYMAESAVAAHSALVAQVEKDVNASFKKELLLEREKIDAVEKLAEAARVELEIVRAERENDNIALMKERAAVESEMEVLSRLRREVEEQLESLISNKVEISYEKERLGKLLKEAEFKNQEIVRLQRELEVERKALSMARAWAEDEAKRAREQAKVLEEARDRWERHGIKVVVDDDLREEENVGVTWLEAGKQLSVEGTVSRAENLVDKLKAMAVDVRGKAKDTISNIIQKVLSLISHLKGLVPTVQQARELRDNAISKIVSSLEEFTLALKEGAKKVREDCKERAKKVGEECKEGAEKLAQKFKI